MKRYKHIKDVIGVIYFRGQEGFMQMDTSFNLNMVELMDRNFKNRLMSFNDNNFPSDEKNIPEKESRKKNII